MKKTLLSLSYIILAFLLVIGVSDGLAKVKSDGKIYSGIGCTEAINGITIPIPGDISDNDVRFNGRGWAFNSNTENAILVSCPIVREHTSNPVKNFHLSVLNATDEDVICQIESYNNRGEGVDESSIFKFLPEDSGFPQTQVKSNEDDLDLTLTNPGGYYVLQCLLPAGLFDPDKFHTEAAYIVTYQMDEARK